MQNNQSSVGGYFALEINNRGSVYHDKALALNTGRNCFEHILVCFNIKKIYIPYYTCEVILEPLERNNIEYTYYEIDDDFLPKIQNINKEYALLYTNYFGLMNRNVLCLSNRFRNLIIDNSQAFYDYPLNGVPTFYSPRKFFGVPDGGFVYHANQITDLTYEVDYSSDRIEHLLLRMEKGAELGYSKFIEDEKKLGNSTIKRMSILTRVLLSGIDFEKIRERRLSNFYFLHSLFKSKNALTSLIENSNLTCPLVYPLFIGAGAAAREKLKKNKIYTATYWPNIFKICPANSFEFLIADNIINLPIDQRYINSDLEKISDLLS